MKTLAELKREIEELLIKSSIDEAQLDGRLLICEALGLSFLDYAMENTRRVSLQEYADVMKLVALRQSRMPISQIFGEKEFWSLTFKVTPDVLTPRPDSETLIETALREIPNKALNLKILDMGTGSGCLLLALLSEYSLATGVGIDVSENALNVARENAHSLGLADRTEFLLSNWTSELECAERFDVIIANPPYIGTNEKNELSPEVKDHEPEQALFSGPDGLDDYRNISRQITPFLKKDGVIFLEIGHLQAHAVKEIFTCEGFNDISIYKDMGNRDRCLMIKK